jgi:hypothetical protein
MNKPVAVIIAGALASIATSQVPPDWTLSDVKDLPAAGIDDAHPSVRYRIRAERSGSFNGTESGTTEVGVRLDTTATVDVTAELRSSTHPDIAPSTVTAPASSFNFHVSLAAWLECAADPCVEEFELTIRRGAAMAEVIGVSGSVASNVAGEGTEPVGAVTVTVMGPIL